MKISISVEEFKALGYHFSYPLLLEKTKQKQPLLSILTDRQNEIDSINIEQEKQKNISKKKTLQEDYDVDDPFIDDREVTAQYESIFQIMDEEDTSNENVPNRNNLKHNRDNLNFYVYRGPLEVDYIEKEFEPSKKKKKSKKKKQQVKKLLSSQVDKLQSTSDNSQPTVVEKDEKSFSQVSNKKRTKKKSFASSEITQRIKEMEDKLENVLIKTNSSTKKTSPSKSRKQYDTDVQVANCEYLDSLENFSNLVSNVACFDPIKFPNSLRPPLEQVMMAFLRKEGNFNDGLFEEISKLIPIYTAKSLKKLAYKKVLQLMLPSEEKLKDSLQTINNETRIIFDQGKVIEGKGKFSESLRESIYNHVRLKINYEIIKRSLKLINEENESANDNQTPPVPAIEIKRNAFKEIADSWPIEQWKINQGDISKEFSAIKRKTDQRILRKHGIKLQDIVINKAQVSDAVEEGEEGSMAHSSSAIKALFTDDEEKTKEHVDSATNNTTATTMEVENSHNGHNNVSSSFDSTKVFIDSQLNNNMMDIDK